MFFGEMANMQGRRTAFYTNARRRPQQHHHHQQEGQFGLGQLLSLLPLLMIILSSALLSGFSSSSQEEISFNLDRNSHQNVLRRTSSNLQYYVSDNVHHQLASSYRLRSELEARVERTHMDRADLACHSADRQYHSLWTQYQQMSEQDRLNYVERVDQSERHRKSQCDLAYQIRQQVKSRR